MFQNRRILSAVALTKSTSTYQAPSEATVPKRLTPGCLRLLPGTMGAVLLLEDVALLKLNH